MEFQTTDHILKVPTAGKNVIDSLTGIIEDIQKDGFQLTDLTNNAGKLSTGLLQYKEIADSIKGKGRDELAAYLVEQVFEVLDKNSD